MRHVRIVALAATAALVSALPLSVSAQDKDAAAQKKASVSSSSGGQCIAPSVVTTVDECPAGSPRLDKGTTLLGKSQAPKSNLVASERKKDKAVKVETATTMWVPAVNNDGRFGHWAFLEITDPWDAGNLILSHLRQGSGALA